MKFEVVLTQVKTLSIDVDAKDRDSAICLAKEEITRDKKKYFDTRLGVVIVARVRQIK